MEQQKVHFISSIMCVIYCKSV